MIRYVLSINNPCAINKLLYLNQLSNPAVTEEDVESVQRGLEAANIGDSEISKLQEKQRAAVRRAVERREPGLLDSETSYSSYGRSPSNAHPDLQDLSFGELGAEQR